MQVRPPLYGWGADPFGFNQAGPTAQVQVAPGLGMMMPSPVQPAIAVAAASSDAAASAALAPLVCAADAGGSLISARDSAISDDPSVEEEEADPLLWRGSPLCCRE
jgi:hypothetical protein